MKKFLLYILASASLTSCYDLDRFPQDKVNSGIFWQTEEHAKQAVMGVYSDLRSNQAFGYAAFLDCVSDIGSGHDAYSYEAIYRGNMTPRSPDYVLGKWKALYDGIARANVVLQNIDQVEMDADSKNAIVGEAKFLRAVYYNELLKFYGGVPLYDETVVVAEDFSNMLSSRSSADDVRKFVLADLTEAIGLLPVKWESTDYGRATKGAAHALRAKVYLYNKNYQEAISDFEEIVQDPSGQGYGYSLAKDYAKLFTPEGDQDAEMIFAVQNSGGVGMDYGMPFAFHMGTRSTYGSCWGNVMPSPNLVDMYENKDGSPFNWNDWFPNFNESNEVKDEVLMSELNTSNLLESYTPHREKLLEMWESRDPRLNSNVILPYTLYKGWTSNAPKDCEYIIQRTGAPHESNGMIRSSAGSAYRPYLWRKFVPEYDMNGQITNREHTPINYPIIRYADVLLMLAECYNETNQQTEAVALINQVRTRVDMPGINSGPAFLEARTKEQVFERIKKERAFELAAEGHRYHDIKRWGLAEEMIVGAEHDMIGGLRYIRKFEKRDYLWPIPGSEIDTNPELTQNEGWN